MKRIDELARLVGWSGERAPAAGLHAAEQALGVRLPTDYREFVRRFPPGVFQDFLVVLHVRSTGNAVGIAHAVPRIVANLQDDLIDAVDFPYPLFPEPGGLLPWGYIGMDDIFFWRTEGDNPDDWETVVADSWLSEHHRYAGSLTDCVLDLLNGTSGLPEMDHLSARKPSFVPLIG